MKLSLLSVLLVCGCLASFRAQAISTEYDWVGDSPSASYSGDIILNQSSNPFLGGSSANIVSYNFTANGINFNSGNSSILSLSPLFYWNSSTIEYLSLTLKSSSGFVFVSLTDDSLGGYSTPTKSGEWDAAKTAQTPNSVPDAASTMVLFAIALAALGWFYLGTRRQRMTAVRVERIINR